MKSAEFLKRQMKHLMLERDLQVDEIAERKRLSRRDNPEYWTPQDLQFLKVKRQFIASHNKRITALAGKIQRVVEAGT